MRRRHAVVAAAVAVLAAGGVWAVMAALTGSSLDADESAVVEAVERGSHGEPADAASFVDENIAVLLSEDVAAEVDGADLAALFEAAFDGDGTDGLFETVVAAVAEEGAIHRPELRPVFGEAAASRLAWFDARVDAFPSDSSDDLSELPVPESAAFVFLREAMRDPAVAEQLRRSMADYGRAEVAVAPVTGRERTSRLMSIGGLQGFLTLVHLEAEEHEARLDDRLDGVQAAAEADRARRQEDRVDRAMWVALDRFESDAVVRAAAMGEPFADARGGLQATLTESETEALKAWVMSEIRHGGLLVNDMNDLDAGIAIVRGE